MPEKLLKNLSTFNAWYIHWGEFIVELLLLAHISPFLKLWLKTFHPRATTDGHFMHHTVLLSLTASTSQKFDI